MTRPSNLGEMSLLREDGGERPSLSRDLLLVVHRVHGGISFRLRGEADEAETTAAQGRTVFDDDLRSELVSPFNGGDVGRVASH